MPKRQQPGKKATSSTTTLRPTAIFKEVMSLSSYIAFYVREGSEDESSLSIFNGCTLFRNMPTTSVTHSTALYRKNQEKPFIQFP